MDYDRAYFAGKSCAVTGAASGIGLALAEELLESGAAHVTLADFNEKNLNEHVARLDALYPGRVRGALCNVTIEAQVADMVETAFAFGGHRLDLLVNCAGSGFAGVFSRIKPLNPDNPFLRKYITNEDWQKSFALNFYGPLYGCRAAIPKMVAQGGGQIANIISGIAFAPIAFNSPYAATKAALLALSLSLRSEYEHYGVKITPATPGTTATAIFAGKTMPPDAQPPHASAQRILNGLTHNARVIFGDDSDVEGAYSCFFPDLGGKVLDKVYRGYARQRMSGQNSFAADGVDIPADPFLLAVCSRDPNAIALLPDYLERRDNEGLDQAYYEGKTALVTGGASGIGFALSSLLLTCGAKGVVLADFNRDQLAQRVDELNARFPGRVHGVFCDVTNEESVQAMVQQGVSLLGGRLDLLINCAGVGQMGQFVALPDSEEMQQKLHLKVATNEDWQRVFAVNFYGPLYGCRAAIPVMKAQGGGQIVNIISGTAFTPLPFQPIYSASKAALNLLTLDLRYEYWDEGIRINSATPGTTATPIFKGAGIPAGAQSPEQSALHVLVGVARNDRVILGDNPDVSGAIFCLNMAMMPALDKLMNGLASSRRQGALNNYESAGVFDKPAK